MKVSEVEGAAGDGPPRFEAVCIEGGYEAPLRDLVVGIFALLEHTPFEKMGLNYFAHHALEREEQWEWIERRLFVRSPFDGVLAESHLRSLVLDGRHEEAPGARIQIKVEPSIRVRPGLFVATNEHYDETGVEAGHRLMDVLNRRWETSLSYARRVASHLHSLRHEERR